MSSSYAERRPHVPFWRLRVVRHAPKAPAPSVHDVGGLHSPHEGDFGAQGGTCPNAPRQYASDAQ